MPSNPLISLNFRSRPGRELSNSGAPFVSSPSERVAVVVNYDSFTILPALVDEYSAMVKHLTARFYSRVTRYGTGGFLKARLEAGKAGPTR